MDTVAAALKAPRDEALNDELYSALKGSKEEDMLRLMDDLATREAALAKPKQLPDMSLRALGEGFILAWSGIVHDVMLLGSGSPISLERLVDILFSPDRQMYFGMGLVLLALVMFLADIF
jgi:hypothetical protein